MCRFLNRRQGNVLAGNSAFPEPAMLGALAQGKDTCRCQLSSGWQTRHRPHHSLNWKPRTPVSGKVDLRCCTLQAHYSVAGGGPGGGAKPRKHLGWSCPQAGGSPCPGWQRQRPGSKHQGGARRRAPNESSPPLAPRSLGLGPSTTRTLARKAPEACGSGGAGFFPRKRRRQVLLPRRRNTASQTGTPQAS